MIGSYKVITPISWPNRVASGRCSAGSIKRERLIVVRSALRNFASMHQGHAH